MESTAAWVPFDIQLSNWTMEYAGWAPAGCPVESKPTETFGSSWLQTSSGGQMVQYAAATDDDSIDKAAQEFDQPQFHNKIPANPIHLFEDVARAFKVDIDMKKMKIHKFLKTKGLQSQGWWPLGHTTMARTISSRRRKPNMWLPTTASWSQATQSKTCMMPLSPPHTMPAAYTTRM
jgi:hypothetical protein